MDLLIAPVRKINARAEWRVETQLTAELKKVRGKEGILFRRHLIWLGKLPVMEGIVERLVPDELWELFQR
ncbi:hypothetical protein, partial [Streptomyces tendae]|uniref:hypothetical protein n=1 Tax=Streptomyces tendae TaxID=1932 RepID=UPI0036BCAA2A